MLYFISLCYCMEDKSVCFNPEETNTLKSILELHVSTFLEQLSPQLFIESVLDFSRRGRFFGSLAKLNTYRWFTVVMRVATLKMAWERKSLFIDTNNSVVLNYVTH